MENMKIAIIGAGHMGSSLADGLIKSHTVLGKNLLFSNPHVGKLNKYKKFGVFITTNNKKVATEADIIILAVRPGVVAVVIKEIKNKIKKNAIILSVAACVDFELLENYFKPFKVKIVRLMPNIPVLYNCGVVGWVGNKNIGVGDKKTIKELLKPLGMIIDCKDEKELDRVDIFAGCGPGIVAYIMRNFEKAAEKYGFSKILAEKMTRQVFTGSLKHLENTGIKSEDLIIQVATKGGITEEVLRTLDVNRFYGMILKSIKKGYQKVIKITEYLKRERKV
jgi:pyrroline-5-carboxylate reductase